MDLHRLTRSTPLLLVIIVMMGLGFAAYSITANQPVNVTIPFTVSIVSSEPGVTCTGGASIICTSSNLGVGGIETLTATVTFNTASQVSFTASSANQAIATITPGSGVLNTASPVQAFTVTGVAAGSTSISISFS